MLQENACLSFKYILGKITYSKNQLIFEITCLFFWMQCHFHKWWYETLKNRSIQIVTDLGKWMDFDSLLEAVLTFYCDLSHWLFERRIVFSFRNCPAYCHTLYFCVSSSYPITSFLRVGLIVSPATPKQLLLYIFVFFSVLILFFIYLSFLFCFIFLL